MAPGEIKNTVKDEFKRFDLSFCLPMTIHSLMVRVDGAFNGYFPKQRRREFESPR